MDRGHVCVVVAAPQMLEATFRVLFVSAVVFVHSGHGVLTRTPTHCGVPPRQVPLRRVPASRRRKQMGRPRKDKLDENAGPTGHADAPAGAVRVPLMFPVVRCVTASRSPLQQAENLASD